MKFVVGLGVLLLAVDVAVGASMHNPFYCHATDPIRPMTTMASTFTSYEAIRRINFTTVSPYISTCTPSRIWYLGRYGARYPTLTLMQDCIALAKSSLQADIVKNYKSHKTTLCTEDFEALRDFSLNSGFAASFRVENTDTVTASGVIQIENIARRLQEKFPNILPTTYSPERFRFRHTFSNKTTRSSRAFATGLFGEAGAQNVIYEHVPDYDWFLRPFNLCPAFIAEAAGSDAKQIVFREGPEVQEMMEQVHQKLGLKSGYLTFFQIRSIWNWCRVTVGATFEESNSEIGPESPWCAAFSVAHHMLFEYYEDLGLYHASGYGMKNQRLVENLNCGVMQDLLNHMQSESEPLVRIYISNYEAIHIMLVLLGSFRDTWPVHQYNYDQQLTRHWRPSLLVQTGANIAVVRYDCDDGDHDLIFYLNEHPILIPGCDQQNGVCKLSVLLERFRRFVGANCEEVFCSNF